MRVGSGGGAGKRGRASTDRSSLSLSLSLPLSLSLHASLHFATHQRIVRRRGRPALEEHIEHVGVVRAVELCGLCARRGNDVGVGERGHGGGVGVCLARSLACPCPLTYLEVAALVDGRGGAGRAQLVPGRQEGDGRRREAGGGWHGPWGIRSLGLGRVPPRAGGVRAGRAGRDQQGRHQQQGWGRRVAHGGFVHRGGCVRERRENRWGRRASCVWAPPARPRPLDRPSLPIHVATADATRPSPPPHHQMSISSGLAAATAGGTNRGCCCCWWCRRAPDGGGPGGGGGRQGAGPPPPPPGPG